GNGGCGLSRSSLVLELIRSNIPPGRRPRLREAASVAYYDLDASWRAARWFPPTRCFPAERRLDHSNRPAQHLSLPARTGHHERGPDAVSQVTPKRRSRRLNLRALIVVTVALLVGAPVLAVLKSVQDRRGRSALLREARDRLNRGQTALALGYLKRYLEL